MDALSAGAPGAALSGLAPCGLRVVEPDCPVFAASGLFYDARADLRYFQAGLSDLFEMALWSALACVSCLVAAALAFFAGADAGAVRATLLVAAGLGALPLLPLAALALSDGLFLFMTPRAARRAWVGRRLEDVPVSTLLAVMSLRDDSASSRPWRRGLSHVAGLVQGLVEEMSVGDDLRVRRLAARHGARRLRRRGLDLGPLSKIMRGLPELAQVRLWSWQVSGVELLGLFDGLSEGAEDVLASLVADVLMDDDGSPALAGRSSSLGVSPMANWPAFFDAAAAEEVSSLARLVRSAELSRGQCDALLALLSGWDCPRSMLVETVRSL